LVATRAGLNIGFAANSAVWTDVGVCTYSGLLAHSDVTADDRICEDVDCWTDDDIVSKGSAGADGGRAGEDGVVANGRGFDDDEVSKSDVVADGLWGAVELGGVTKGEGATRSDSEAAVGRCRASEKGVITKDSLGPRLALRPITLFAPMLASVPILC
jgi:hypothetical protein